MLAAIDDVKVRVLHVIQRRTTRTNALMLARVVHHAFEPDMRQFFAQLDSESVQMLWLFDSGCEATTSS